MYDSVVSTLLNFSFLQLDSPVSTFCGGYPHVFANVSASSVLGQAQFGGITPLVVGSKMTGFPLIHDMKASSVPTQILYERRLTNQPDPTFRALRFLRSAGRSDASVNLHCLPVGTSLSATAYIPIAFTTSGVG